ncbi:metallophosphoesterase family protein [Yinghuangia soli]|uniref:Metallophosphatase family protein n=1 Tax=Yinghuangia soli TaxID=2908204 RepID=A0AA41QBI5_9ACTN|nr:metallophosphoesterase family protein [Yinghuangia soli]MCF2533742.1 metallophosphatase family protein [Yinghuangia soli]
MRILLAGDTHGNIGHVRRVLDAAAGEGIERVFQLGDFGYWEHEPNGVRFLDEAHRSARARGVTLYFLDGNHDKSGLIHERYGDRPDEEGFLSVRGRIRYAPRGHTWEWDGVRFLAFGGARSVDKDWRLQEEARRHQKAARKENYRLAAGRPAEHVADHAGTLWFPEEEATDEDAERVIAAAGRVDILLTHDKPRATSPGTDRKDLDICHPNQDRVQRIVDALGPELAAHGHLHHRYTELLSGPNGDTVVEGLAADPSVSWDVPGYRVADSWLGLGIGDD